MRFTAFVLLSVLVEFAHGFGVSEPTTIKGDPWINELHYDNDGDDKDEKIEVCAPVTTDIELYKLVLYNGKNGLPYYTMMLQYKDEHDLLEHVEHEVEDGQIIDCVAFKFPQIQNGSPDGVALVGPKEVVEFLSYEGNFEAKDGPAAGMTSTNIGVSQKQDTVGLSLQLKGTGTKAEDFDGWGSSPETFGKVNDGQTFG